MIKDHHPSQVHRNREGGNGEIEIIPTTKDGLQILLAFHKTPQILLLDETSLQRTLEREVRVENIEDHLIHPPPPPPHGHFKTGIMIGSTATLQVGRSRRGMGMGFQTWSGEDHRHLHRHQGDGNMNHLG